MAKLQLHVDGSRVLSAGKEVQSFGWGLVAQHGDAHHERAGCVRDHRRSPLGGHHEHIAFVQGVLYAHRMGFAFEDTTIVCDDDIFGYGHGALHPDNYRVSRRQAVLERLALVVKRCFEPSAFELTLQAMRAARILKVKGHQGEVYQERADYLASFAARRGAGQGPEAESAGNPLHYSDWLQRGFVFYEGQGDAVVRKIRYPHFVAAPPQDPGVETKDPQEGDNSILDALEFGVQDIAGGLAPRVAATSAQNIRP